MQPMASVVLVEFRTFSLSSCVSALYLFDELKKLFLPISSVLVCINLLVSLNYAIHLSHLAFFVTYSLPTLISVLIIFQQK